MLTEQGACAQQIQWAGSIGGGILNTQVASTLDNDESLVVVGSFDGTRDFDPSSNTENLDGSSGSMFIAKYNSNGEYQYSKLISGSGLCEPIDVEVDQQNNIYVTGHFAAADVDFDPGTGTNQQSHVGGSDIFLAKYRPDGTFVYARSMGGSGHDFGESIAIDNNSDIIITGRFVGTVDLDPGIDLSLHESNGSSDIFLVKFDSSGTYLYSNSLGGPSGELSHSVAFDDVGNFYLTGGFSSTVDFDPGPDVFELTSNGQHDIFLAKYDPDGNFLFANGFGSSEPEYGKSVTTDQLGNVYVTGRTAGSIDFDPGISESIISSNGMWDMFLCKYSPSGSLLFAKNAGGLILCHGNDIAIDELGNVYLTGYFVGQASFMEGSETIILQSNGQFDNEAFIAKYSSTGTLIEVGSFGGSELDDGICINSNNSGEVYVSGRFTGNVDFNPNGSPIIIESTGGPTSIYISKYSTMVGLKDVEFKPIEIYPNPASDRLFFKTTETIRCIHIYEVSGRKVERISQPRTSEIDVSRLAKGSYFIRADFETGFSHSFHLIIGN